MGKENKLTLVDINSTATIYLRKDGRTWDMRYKENKYWQKIFFPKKPWYDKPLQNLANRLGSPVMFHSHVKWRLWLNPIWQFKQWKFRTFDIKKPIQFHTEGVIWER